MADVRNLTNSQKVTQVTNEALSAGGSPDGSGGPFLKGLVVEVVNYVYDWDFVKQEYQDQDLFKDERSHELVPRNTVLAKLLDDSNTTKMVICYPFFPSHLMLSLIHISEPTRQAGIWYGGFCL